jgi:hypothetical protein
MDDQGKLEQQKLEQEHLQTERAGAVLWKSRFAAVLMGLACIVLCLLIWVLWDVKQSTNVSGAASAELLGFLKGVRGTADEAQSTIEDLHAKVKAIDADKINTAFGGIHDVEVAAVGTLNGATNAELVLRGNLSEMQTFQVRLRETTLEKGGLISNLDESLNGKNGTFTAITTSLNRVSDVLVPIKSTAEQLPPTLVSMQGFLNQGTTLEKSGDTAIGKFTEFMGTAGTPDKRGIPQGGIGLIGFMAHAQHVAGLGDEEATNLFHPLPCLTAGCKVKRVLTFAPKFVKFGFDVYNEVHGFPVNIIGGAVK